MLSAFSVTVTLFRVSVVTSKFFYKETQDSTSEGRQHGHIGLSGSLSLLVILWLAGQVMIMIMEANILVRASNKMAQ